MAVSLSPACDPIASWYHFDYSLSWSDNCEVAQVLSDIPFISVGILVFGVSVSFLVFQRVSLSAACLFFSVLLAFIAAVLDLGQTLSTTSKHSQPAIRAREVLFAFSTGLRFLFYWSYVAEAPSKARYAASIQRVRRIKFFTFECTQRSEPNSTSWTRWGLPGRLLGLSLLASIIIVTALQIVWRVVPQFHQYGSVYAADAVLELLLSFLLLLKLLGTVTLDSPDSMLVYTFRKCLAPIFGLLANIAIGVGDLLYFAFTESTVGRILQAFEVFIIAVFVVTTALLNHCHIPTPTASSQGETRRDAVFTLPKLPRESTFRIVPPVIETPRMSVALGFATQNKESSRGGLYRLAPPSLNQVSSWMSSRVSRSRPHHEDEEVKLWNAKEAEGEPGRIDTQLQASTVLMTHEPQERTEPMHNASADPMAITSDLDDQSKIARFTEGSIHTSQAEHPYRADVPRRTVPLEARTSFVHSSSGLPSATSGAKQTANMTPSLDASPVYGPGDIQSLANTSDLRTSLDELLNQQSQLDRSIEALKLFSARTSTDSSSSNYVQNSKSVKLTRSSSIGQRTTCSDVSLSSFPIPPWLTTPVPSPPPSRVPSTMRIREDRRVRHAARSNPVQDISPRSSGTTYPLLVETDKYLSADVGKDSADPGETRYNVTSFIGGLATLDEPRQEVALSPQTPVTSYAEEGLPLPPIRPVQKTGSPIAVSAEGADRVQKMSVRPRPPPLALQSYSVPRIQVVADD